MLPNHYFPPIFSMITVSRPSKNNILLSLSLSLSVIQCWKTLLPDGPEEDEHYLHPTTNHHHHHHPALLPWVLTREDLTCSSANVRKMQSDSSSLRTEAQPASSSHKITHLAVVMTAFKTKRQPSSSRPPWITQLLLFSPHSFYFIIPSCRSDYEIRNTPAGTGKQ